MATEVVIEGSYGSGCVPRQIVLLRGINLGSRNRVAMPELREVLEGAGFEDVQTYVQSGDVATDPKRYQVSFLEGKLDRQIAEKVKAAAVEPEQVVIAGREIYAWHPS